MKLRKTVHVKKKEQLDATKVSKRVKPIPKVRRIDRLQCSMKKKDSVKVGNHCMQLAVAIKAKEVGIGWPWVTCTGDQWRRQGGGGGGGGARGARAPPPPPPPPPPVFPLIMNIFIMVHCLSINLYLHKRSKDMHSTCVSRYKFVG